MDNVEFGQRLASLRNRRGLTQDMLSKNLNIAKSTIAMYETCKREPDFEMLIVLSDYFNVTIDYLVRGRKRETQGSA